MRIAASTLLFAAIFFALMSSTPNQANARVSVYLGYGGVHIYVGPKYRKYRRYRRYRKYRRHYRVRHCHVRRYYSRRGYIRRKRVCHRHYRRYR